jgi:RHS repeat-associated protein
LSVVSASDIDRQTHAITHATTSSGAIFWSSPLPTVASPVNGNFTKAVCDAEDQLTAEGATGSVRTYGWDNRGRLISRSATASTNGFTYGWDSRDHMTSSANTTASTTRTYQYDPSGRLVAARGGGLSDEFFLYRDGTEPIAWTRGGLHQYYVYGSQRHVPDLIYEDNDGDVQIDNVYRVLTDERGSVRMVVSLAATPVIVQRIEYDVFGNPTFPVGGEGVQPFGFAGAIWLRHARFWHMGARDYDPAVGRWTSKDSIRFAGGSNLYVYCEGDPVNFVDTTGENPLLIVLIGVAVWLGLTDNYDVGPSHLGPGSWGAGEPLVGEEHARGLLQECGGNVHDAAMIAQGMRPEGSALLNEPMSVPGGEAIRNGEHNLFWRDVAPSYGPLGPSAAVFGPLAWALWKQVRRDPSRPTSHEIALGVRGGLAGIHDQW